MWEIVEEAARQVITTSAGLGISSVVKPAKPARDLDGFVATISLVGTKGGTLVVYCQRPTAAALAAGMMGADDLDDETVRDALGEVLNQIAGTIKRMISADGQEIKLTVPVVVAGSPLSHSVKCQAEPVSVELRIDEQHCFVCLWPTT